jgi:hypothetical protein
MRDKIMGTRAVEGLPPLTAFPWAMDQASQVVYVDCKDDKLALRTPVAGTLVPYSKTNQYGSPAEVPEHPGAFRLDPEIIHLTCGRQG